MSFHNPTRHELAVHEAGHAYAFASIVRYEEPYELGLGRNDGGHHGWCSRRTILHRDIRLASVPADCRPSFEWQAAAEVVIAIAGSVAEFRHRHRGRMAGVFLLLDNAERFLQPGTFDVDGDFERIRATLDYIEAPDPLRTFRELIGVCDEVVARNWRSIVALSRLLLERGVLGEDELLAWFEAHPAMTHAGTLGI